MGNNSFNSPLIDKFAWAIMALVLSIQPLLGFPFSIIAVIYGLTYKDDRKLSFVRLINFMVGLTGIVLSILTFINRGYNVYTNIFLFE